MIFYWIKKKSVHGDKQFDLNFMIDEHDEKSLLLEMTLGPWSIQQKQNLTVDGFHKKFLIFVGIHINLLLIRVRGTDYWLSNKQKSVLSFRNSREEGLK